jgi:putative inorganic carbon (hco3(-)) transporter
MIEPQGAKIQDLHYIPREETRVSSSTGPSFWLVLLSVIVIPGAIAYSLTLYNTAYSIAVFAALLVGTAIMARPFAGLVVILMLIYCRPEELVPEITGMRLTLIVTSLTLFGTWIHIFVNRQRMTKTPVVGFMLGIAALAPISAMLTGGEPSEAIREVWLLTLLVLMILNLVRTRAAYQIFVTGIISVTTYLALYSLYLLNFAEVGYKIRGAAEAERSLVEGSIFHDPNDLASALVPGLALVLMRFLQARGWRKAPYGVVAAILLYGTFATESRGGYIALVLMVAAFVVINVKKKVVAVGVAAILALGIMVGASSRMSTIDVDDENAQTRLQFWQNGLDALQESPVIGVGYNQYNTLNRNKQAPHNTFLQLLVELGPIGFFCFMGLFYYAFRWRTAAGRDYLPTDQDRMDLLAARLSLMGFMLAAFFLSRAYVPCLYIQCCLPIVQQISASGRTDALDVTPKERFGDWLGIALACVALVLGIKFLLFRYL